MFLSTRRRHFDDRNDFLALSTVFYDIIGDETLSETYFVVDALDNCSSDQERPGLDHFLHLIARSMTLSNKIRWLVSGNHSDPVKSVLEEVGYLHVKLGPGLQGSRKAVDSYVRSKVSMLARANKYDRGLETSVAKTLCDLAQANYVWVNIVCTALRAEEVGYASSVLGEVKDLTNLHLLYDHMKRALDSLPRQDNKFCTEVLSTVAIAHDALPIDELVCLAPRVNLTAILERSAPPFFRYAMV